MEEIVKRLHEQRRIEKAKEILESAGYTVNESNYKCYALMEYEPGNGETGIEGDKFFTLDVVKAGDEEEANRYFKNLRGRFPDAYVTEISEEDFDKYYQGAEEAWEEHTRNTNESRYDDLSSEAPPRNHLSSREEKLAYANKLLNMARENGSDTDAAWALIDFLYDTDLLSESVDEATAEELQKKFSEYQKKQGDVSKKLDQTQKKSLSIFNRSKKMRESNYIRREFPTEQEAWDYARDNGLEVSKTQDCEDKCVAWFRKFDYKPEQKREELPGKLK